MATINQITAAYNDIADKKVKTFRTKFAAITALSAECDRQGLCWYEAKDGTGVYTYTPENEDLTSLEKIVIGAMTSVFNYGTAEDEIDDNAHVATVEDITTVTSLNIDTIKGVVGSLFKKDLLEEREYGEAHEEMGFGCTEAGIRCAFRYEDTVEEPTPAPKGKGGRALHASDARITIQKANPKRPGTKAHARYELYRTGQTVADFLEAGGRRADLRWDEQHGNITIKK